jgi:hypothetical protein
LFRAVSRWGTCELKRQNLLDTPENKRVILADVLMKIRFPSMSMEEIATHVTPSGLLTSPQLLEIFSYVGITDKSKFKKISWLTTPRAGSKEKCKFLTRSINPALLASFPPLPSIMINRDFGYKFESDNNDIITGQFNI